MLGCVIRQYLRFRPCSESEASGVAVSQFRQVISFVNLKLINLQVGSLTNMICLLLQWVNFLQIAWWEWVKSNIIFLSSNLGGPPMPPFGPDPVAFSSLMDKDNFQVSVNRLFCANFQFLLATRLRFWWNSSALRRRLKFVQGRMPWLLKRYCNPRLQMCAVRIFDATWNGALEIFVYVLNYIVNNKTLI